MSNEGKDGPGGMEPGDDEALWRLLGQARPPQAGPYFSRRVLREVARLDEPSAEGWPARWWRQVWRRPGVTFWPGVAAVAVFWLSVELAVPPATPRGAARPARTPEVPPARETASAPADGNRGAAVAATPAADEAVAPQDVEVIADLDDMIAREENRLWTEDTARF